MTAEDGFRILKTELRNCRSRMSYIAGLRKMKDGRVLQRNQERIVEWCYKVLENIQDECIRFYMIDIYMLKRTQLGQAAEECGFSNSSVMIKKMKKEIEQVMTPEVYAEYRRLLDEEEKLKKQN